ncbi:MAG: GldG family protein [Chloroflexi bacterium]|nr:GldG family protein [Chloroflexota bacterium]
MRGDELLRRLGPVAGIAGGLALFAAAGAALVIGVQQPVFIWLLIAAGLLLLFFFATDVSAVLQFFTTRTVRYSSHAGLMTILFLGIFIVINFLAVQHNVQWDMTQSGRYTLSKATKELLAGLKQPVQIIAFYAPNPSGGGTGETAAKQLLQRYTALSKKISVTFVDPDANPAEAQKYHVTVSPTIVVLSGGHQDSVQIADEQDISSAIERVTAGKTPVVYFLQGNGEPSMQPANGPSFSTLVSFLKKNNLEAKPLTLPTVSQIPADAAAVVEADPTTPLSPQEQRILLDYLDHGGHVLTFANPFAKVSLDWLVKPFGLSISDGLVVDLSPGGHLSNSPEAVVISRYQQGAMLNHTLPLGVYLDTTSIGLPKTPNKNITIQTIAQTSSESFLVTDPKATSINPSKDPRGPFNIVVSAERKAAPAIPAATPTPNSTPTPNAGKSATAKSQPSSKLVVIGSTLFATDQLLTSNPAIQEGNSEIITAALQWLTASPNQLVIPVKAPTDHSIVLAGWQGNALIAVNALLIPVVVLLGGLGVWLRRR